MRVTLVDIPRISQSGALTTRELQRKLQFCEHRALVARFPELDAEYAPATYSEGILQLGTILQQRGHDVSVINTDMLSLTNAPDDLAEKIVEVVLDHNPNVVGFGCKTPAYDLATLACRRLRAVAPSVRLIFGGPHPTACDTQCLEDFPDAVVIRHEADEVLPTVLSRWQAGDDLAGVPSLTYHDGRRVVRSEPAAAPVDLTEVPPIDYTLLPGNPALYHPYVATTRGCPRDCAFCANAFLWQRQVRRLPPETVRRNLAWWVNRLHGPRTLHVADAFINMSDAQCAQVAALTAPASRNLIVSADIAPDHVSDRQLAAIDDSPIRILCLGIETITKRVRSRVSKRGTVDSIYWTLRQLKHRVPNCFVKAYWILGLPGEDSRSVRDNQEAIRWLLEAGLIDMVNAKPFVPLPGSDVFMHPTRYGVCLHAGADWGQYAREAPILAYHTDMLTAEQVREAWEATMRDCIGYYETRFGAAPVEVGDDTSKSPRRVL